MKEVFEIGNFISNFLSLLITLNISLITLLMAITEKVFTVEKIRKSNRNKVLFSLSTFLFLISLSLSLFISASIPSNIVNILDGKSKYWVAPIPFQGAILSLFLGILLFLFLALSVFFDSQNTPIYTRNIKCKRNIKRR